jgi:2-deoxy-D-gluconate 3-dehydrogenase
MKELFSLEGKVAIVTGGNGGIGLGISRAFASDGSDLAIVARNQEKTEKAVYSALKDAGGGKIINILSGSAGSA